MSSRRPRVSREDARALNTCAIRAVLLEYDTQAQSDADNEFHEIAERYLTAHQKKQLQAQTSRATVEERIRHTLRLLGVPIPPEVTTGWQSPPDARRYH
jgi:hypothetical protein